MNPTDHSLALDGGQETGAQLAARGMASRGKEHWFPLANRPLLLLCLAFLVGIWLGAQGVVTPACWVLVGVIAASGVLVAHRPWAAAVAGFVGALSCGALLFVLHSLPRRDDVSLFAHVGDAAHVEGYVVAQLPSRAGRAQFLLRAVRLEVNGQIRPVSGCVLVIAPEPGRALEGSPVTCEGIVSKPKQAGNPGEFDLAMALARRHARLILEADFIAPSEHLSLPLRHRVRRAAAGFRQKVVGRLRDCMPGPYADQYAELLAAIVYGAEVTPVPEAWARSARETGTIHLLVVSGAQITLLSAVVLGLCTPRRSAVWRWIGARLRGVRESRVVPPIRWWQAVLVVAAVSFFALMVGTGPSVSRAVIMAFLALWAGVFDYDYDPYTALGLAGAAICALDPGALHSISAQLSFGATLGVLIALRSLPSATRRTNVVLRVLLGSLVALVGVWLFVTPLLAHHFGAFPILGSLANIAAVPLCGAALTLTLIAMPLCFVSPSLVAVVLHPARWLVEGILQTNELFRTLPLAYYAGYHLGTEACVAWYVGLALIGCAYRARGSWGEWMTPKRAAGAGLLAAVFVSVWFAIRANTPGQLVVTFLDVGRGQCCIIQAASGRTIMVDAGSDETLSAGRRCAREVILPFLASRRINRLDALVITHRDADHYNAVPTVLRSVPVGVILESFSPSGSETYAVVEEAAAARGVRRVRASAGGVINLGADARAYILWPTGTASDQALDDNDRSIVLRVVHRRVTALLTADITVAAENELLRRGAPLRADILQVAHHGSSGSSGWAFLQAVRPSVAVVSCAADDPDHPSPTVQSRLRSLGTQLWRTDQDGAVTIASNGAKITVRAYRSRRQAHSRSAVWAHALASASSTGSGSWSAREAISAGNFTRNTSAIRRLMAARTSGASSPLLARKRSTAARSSAVMLRAAGRRMAAR